MSDASDSLQQLLAFDSQHIWHPYAAMPNPVETFLVEKAEGVMLTLKDGRELIDGMSSWWAAIHGYNHPVLNEAIKSQLDKMAHVMFGGLTHEPAIKLCKTLVEITPEPLQKVFLSDSGSVSVEVAIKMALQYWLSQGKAEKHRLLTLKGGYHGDTFATMAVCDPVNGMHHLFDKVLTQHLFAEAPSCFYAGTDGNDNWHASHLDNLKDMLQQHHHEVAAVILEPIVQGTGGMNFYAPKFLQGIRELCDEFDVLLILDEIATGFGRTGKLFGCNHSDSPERNKEFSPDILCLGKTLTAGYMTLAATLCTDKVANGISQGEVPVLMHGPTYMGNPLACTVANTSIELLLQQKWQANIKRIEQGLIEGLQSAKEIKDVADVRVLGAIGVIELEQPVDMKTIQPMFVENGIWIRPFGKLVYTMPPYITDNRTLSLLCQKINNVLESYL